VLVDGIHVAGHSLTITAKRMVAFSVGRIFQLRVDEQKADQKADHEKIKPLLLEIQADLGREDSASEQSDAAMARIFLTPQDDFARLIPDYWKPCVPTGLAGKNSDCHFSPEILAIPGVTHAQTSAAEATSTGLPNPSLTPVFRVGKGVSPPTVITHIDPEVSAYARRAKFQGTITLLLVVNRDGLPTNIHIGSPLGGGLDAKAVRAAQSWRFKPAEKDGQPVAVEIALEVNFHLY
jgi:TonB family protein